MTLGTGVGQRLVVATGCLQEPQRVSGGLHGSEPSCRHGSHRDQGSRSSSRVPFACALEGDAGPQGRQQRDERPPTLPTPASAHRRQDPTPSEGAFPASTGAGRQPIPACSLPGTFGTPRPTFSLSGTLVYLGRAHRKHTLNCSRSRLGHTFRGPTANIQADTLGQSAPTGGR